MKPTKKRNFSLSTVHNGPNRLQVPYGKWQVTDTVSSTRKNLFCIEPNNGFHIGTIVSGSRSRLDRFEHSLSMMCAVPEMLYVLETIAASLRAGEGLDRSTLLSEIETILDGIAPLTAEE